MATLRELGEFEAIRRIVAARPLAGQGVRVNAGDDGAVLRLEAGQELVVTTDAFVEGRHWRKSLIDSATLGARLAAANLSDLAAMGAQPLWGLVSCGIGRDHEFESLLALDGGVAGALARFGAALVGGNLSAIDGPEWMSFTLLGACAAGHAWQRGGARPGDLLAVTGHPGRAAAGLRLLEQAGNPATAGLECIAAWRTPLPRMAFVAACTSGGAPNVTAAIDLSDGFVADLAHLCAASRVGAEIDDTAWRDPALDQAAATLATPASTLRYGASDDYELLLAITPAAREAMTAAAAQTHTPLTFVGHCTTEHAILLRGAEGDLKPLSLGGWDHFSST